MPERPVDGWSATPDVADDGLLAAGFGSVEVAAIVGWPARIARMLDVEVALAATQADVGAVPSEAATAIAEAARLEHLDLGALRAAAADAATPVIALLAAVRAAAERAGTAVLVEAHLHRGATSQDVVDTATVLQVRDAAVSIDGSSARLEARCIELAAAHRDTVVAGRTLGQQAVPVTFGLVAVRWADAIARRRVQLAEAAARLGVLQLAGAAGTAAAFGPHADAVMRGVADRLGLDVPPLPWHAERDRIVELAGALTGLVSVVDKIASDVVRLAATEVGEVHETAAGGPTSSALAHKRNPVHAVTARAAVRLARGELSVLVDAAGAHEHERAAGAWQAEWVALPGALVRTGGAVERLAACLDGLVVDVARARANLALDGGTVLAEAVTTALTDRIGRHDAQRIVARLSTEAVASGTPLLTAAASDAEVTAVLDAAALAEVTDPAHVTRWARAAVDRRLAAHRATTEQRNDGAAAGERS